MVSWVMRNLRRQKVKNDKKAVDESKKGRAPLEPQACTVTVKEVHELFPGLTEGIIRSRLKDRCSCVAYKVGLSLDLHEGLRFVSLVAVRGSSRKSRICWVSLRFVS